MGIYSDHINEKKLSKLITKNDRNILRVFDEDFYYCNGYIMALCDYSHYDIIGKLIKVGAIANIRDFTPKESIDLQPIIGPDDEEYAAEITGFYVKYFTNELYRIFKINGKLYSYNQKYLDVFEDVEYRATIDKNTKYPKLKIYSKDKKFIGLIMPIRDEILENTKIYSDSKE